MKPSLRVQLEDANRRADILQVRNAELSEVVTAHANAEREVAFREVRVFIKDECGRIISRGDFYLNAGDNFTLSLDDAGLITSGVKRRGK